MSEPPPAPTPEPPGAPPGRKSSWKYTLAVVALLVAGDTGYYFYVKSQNPIPPPVDELKGLREYLGRLSANQKLAEGYTDANRVRAQ